MLFNKRDVEPRRMVKSPLTAAILVAAPLLQRLSRIHRATLWRLPQTADSRRLWPYRLATNLASVVSIAVKCTDQEQQATA